MERLATRDSVAVFQSSGGERVATVVEFRRHGVVFELYTPYVVVQSSEVLSDFKIRLNDKPVYSGRAVVTNIVYTATLCVCEATLEDGWLDVELFGDGNWGQRLRTDFSQFVATMEKSFKILPDFKVTVADMASVLMELRSWLEQIEAGIRSQPAGNTDAAEAKCIQEVQDLLLPVLVELFERFNDVAKQVPEDRRAAHTYYAKKHLHPLVLCAPFMYRTFQKPLGYAGDYEMVNMMLREPYEGGSLFAKALNTFFLNTPPVVAHRNRIDYLTGSLIEETARVVRKGRRARILNLGCGPATEVQIFLAKSELSEHAEFVLLDFNDETVYHTTQVLTRAKHNHQRTTHIEVMKKSVAQLLKEASKPVPKLRARSYDIVYCAGLFDYMPDHVCQKLMQIFYDLAAPEGLIVATNVDPSNPSRGWMELMVEWYLFYRNGKEMMRFVPADAAGQPKALSELSGVNVFLNVRKGTNV